MAGKTLVALPRSLFGQGVGGPAEETRCIMLRNKIQGLEATDPDFPQLSLSERRKKLRVRTYIRLDMIVGQERNSAIVTDLSLNGLRVRCGKELQKGEVVEVALPDSEQSDVGSINCTVVWVTPLGENTRTSFEAGLAFDETQDDMEESWVSYVLEQLGFDENKTFQKRKYLRAAGKVPARIFTQNEKDNITGEILNLGVGGALMASDTALEKNQQISCEICLWRILPALRLPCKVMAVREDSSIDLDSPVYLHSLLFLGMDNEEVKLLGNYVVHLINQSE